MSFIKDNKYLAWTSFILFFLSIGGILLFFVFALVLNNTFENPGILLLVAGAFSLLGALMGFLSFKAPQAKVGGTGNLLILLLVLFVTPIGRETTITPPRPEVSVRETPAHTGIAEIDLVIDTILAGTPEEEFKLLQFSRLSCTHAEGLGGPPKCRADEDEGTQVDVFPFLGPEGHHARKSELSDWPGLAATRVYTVYRVSEQAFSDESYPKGEYAILFLGEDDQAYTTVQVRDGKIVRIDNGFDDPANLDWERLAADFILPPPK